LLQALEQARAAAREDHEARAALQLAGIYIGRMEEDKAEPLIARALALAEESGSIVARASAAQSKGMLHRVRRQFEEAEGWLTKALDLYRETASVSEIAWTSRQLAQVAWETGNPSKAEKLFRESIRLLAPMNERGTLCESQRLLAQLLLAEGRIDEAEKFALAGRETVSAEDVTSRATTRVALARPPHPLATARGSVLADDTGGATAPPTPARYRSRLSPVQHERGAAAPSDTGADRVGAERHAPAQHR